MTNEASTTDAGHFHAVRFYRDSDALAELVAQFIGEGLAEDLPAIVIATAANRDGIVRHLRARSIDVDRLTQNGELILLDAHALLSEIMVDGLPDPRQFREAIIPVIERACRGRTDCVVRAYGEMVDVLWKADQTVAATRLETLWNQLAQTHDFSLLCGYAMGNFYKDGAREKICRQHTHVLSGRTCSSATPLTGR